MIEGIQQPQPRTKKMIGIAGLMAAMPVRNIGASAFISRQRYFCESTLIGIHDDLVHPGIVGSVVFPLTDKLGQPVIVESRPGAGTAVAAGYATNSAPDGYTLLLGTNATFAVNPTLYKKLPYDPADFKMVAAAGRMPRFLLVGGNSKYKTLGEFIQAAREHP